MSKLRRSSKRNTVKRTLSPGRLAAIIDSKVSLVTRAPSSATISSFAFSPCSWAGVFQAQSSACQYFVISRNQVVLATHIAREKLFQTGAGHLLTGFLKIRGGVVASFLKKLCIEITHYIVERLTVVSAPANLQIQQQTEQLAFVVIRDLRVHRAFIRAIVFYPGVKACFLDAHHFPTGRILKIFDLSGEVI